MTWAFGRRARRAATRQHRSFRPSLEVLEGRDVPSVSVTPTTDAASGAALLRVVSSGGNDTVTITDDSNAHTTTGVADGKSQTFNQQFTDFNLALMSRQDSSPSTKSAP
jgi:hypothetical protein